MFPVVQDRSTASPTPRFTTATTSPPSSKSSLNDFGLLIYDRYTNIFEPLDPDSLPDECIRLASDDVLFLIEAPLNAVELYEAILRPRVPLTVHKARTIPRKPKQETAEPRLQDLVTEYNNGQGKLADAADREVSLVTLPRDVIWQLQMFYGFVWPVQLQYLSVPVRVSGAKTVRSPYALVSYNGHKVYHKKLKTLLRDMKLGNSALERSLLRPGTRPVPETLREYLAGESGKDAALPFYERGRDGASGAGEGQPQQRPTILRRVTSNIPLRKAVSRVSLKRSRSVTSMGAGN